eukprot:Seg6497.1 transcript_id=Seg6497.1/GoldUCD/mRNA.D3Y31 product="hypothetical protein" protein_id=Seg6497.1/GoldUCD/D3Y31
MLFNDLYSAKSVAEKGTLYQLKQRFDRRNVKKEVKQAAHACREFTAFVTYCDTVLAAMKILCLADKDQQPSNLAEDNDEEKLILLNNLAKNVVESFVLPKEDCPEDMYNSQLTGKNLNNFFKQHFTKIFTCLPFLPILSQWRKIAQLKCVFFDDFSKLRVDDVITTKMQNLFKKCLKIIPMNCEYIVWT